MESIWIPKTVQRSAFCRSRRELSNAYLLAKIGVDTAENEPLEVWGENSIQYSLHSLGRVREGAQAGPGRGLPGNRRQRGRRDHVRRVRALGALPARAVYIGRQGHADSARRAAPAEA